MHNNHIKFGLEDLPQSDFCVLLNEEVQEHIIDSAAKNISTRQKGKYKDLSEHLKKNCKSFSEVKTESIYDRYISQWKSHKMFIPVDCIIELSRIINIPLSEIEKSIEKIKYKDSPNKTSIKFPFSYNENLAFLGEMIRVEGNIKKNLFHCNVANMDMEIIKKILFCVENCGLSDKGVYTYLRVEAHIPQYKNSIKIVSRSKALKFHIRKPSKATGFKKKICFIDKFALGKKMYLIHLKGKKIYVEVTVPKSGKILSTSSYKRASANCLITIANTTFCRLLSHLLEIPSGKKSEIIKIPQILYSSPQTVKRHALNALLAAESTVEVNAKRIRIGMNSETYLKGLKSLFRDFEVDAKLENRFSLSITGYENLNRVLSNFDFISSDKNEKLDFMVNSYKRIPAITSFRTAVINSQVD